MLIVIASDVASQGPAGLSEVSVNVTLPAAISAAVGVYTACKSLRLGLKPLVVPPLHVPVVVPPLMLPASVTAGLLAHTVASSPAPVVTSWLIVIVIASLVAPHGPAGSSEVSVRVTLPAAISPAVGVYTAFKAVRLGLKLAVVPPLHVPVVIPPLILPARVTAGLVEQTGTSSPALVVTAWLIVPVCEQGCELPPALVSVNDTVNVPVAKVFPDDGIILIDVTLAPDFVVVVLPPLITAFVVDGVSVQA